MKYIKNQVLTSTGIDSHGEQWTKEHLIKFFEQMPDIFNLDIEHDLTKPPCGKAYNKQFVKLENGGYAITVDIEFEDDFDIDKYGGFSISATEKKPPNVTSSEKSVSILYDIRNFTKEELQPIFDLSTTELEIIPNIWKRKAEDSAAIIILQFASKAIAAGFFAKMGADVYDKLKFQLKNLVAKRKKEKKEAPRFQIIFYYNDIRVILDLPNKNIDLINNEKITVDLAISYLEANVGNSKINQVALKLIEKEPFWKMLYFIDKDNDVVEF